MRKQGNAKTHQCKLLNKKIELMHETTHQKKIWHIHNQLDASEGKYIDGPRQDDLPI
jgi:hypothetical protein